MSLEFRCDCRLDGYKGRTCEIATEMSCISQCSGHGACKSGWCKCDEGYYGLDCAQRKAGSLTSESIFGTTRTPCVFIPWEFTSQKPFISPTISFTLCRLCLVALRQIDQNSFAIDKNDLLYIAIILDSFPIVMLPSTAYKSPVGATLLQGQAWSKRTEWLIALGQPEQITLHE